MQHGVSGSGQPICLVHSPVLLSPNIQNDLQVYSY